MGQAEADNVSSFKDRYRIGIENPILLARKYRYRISIEFLLWLVWYQYQYQYRFFKSQYQDWYQSHFAPDSTLKYVVKLAICVVFIKRNGNFM